MKVDFGGTRSGSVPGVEEPVNELRKIVAQLRAPGGCPWDREQTHSALRRDLIEEAYEVVNAIDREDDANLREELGDLLLQVVMHSQIAAEDGRFVFDDVARGISEKLIRRHPHVFGEKRLDGVEEVLTQWDEIKRREKGAAAARLLEDAPALPAAMRAQKVQVRAARTGFDWADIGSVLSKVREELIEVEAELDNPNRLQEEIGDLLFSVVNLSRKAGVDAELALQDSTSKFIRRFHRMEDTAKVRKEDFSSLDAGEMNALWEQVKSDERAPG